MSLESVLENPYLEWFKKREKSRDFHSYSVRCRLVSKYSWAIPNVEAVKLISAYSPLIEIGAGTGYWAFLLCQMGADIVAFDHAPPDLCYNSFHDCQKTWFPVGYGGPDSIKGCPERTLFICWPPGGELDMSVDCLKQYSGEYFLFVGEYGGCTGSEELFGELDANWESIFVVPIPHWPYMNDCLYVFQRVENGSDFFHITQGNYQRRGNEMS